jgi:hypothetical protein
MQRLISGLIAAIALVLCLYSLVWQFAAHEVHFSFVFASAVFAIVCVHWLLEELDLLHPDPSRGLSHEM